MARIPPPGPSDDLARRLHAAAARLAALDPPPEVRARLQRQFIAVCDAAKTPGADQQGCLRRLEAALTSMDSVIDKKSAYRN
jgi:hypothetical protein